MNKLALITGASSGLGEVFARKLARKGMNLILVARREDRLKQISDELNSEHGVDIGICVADLAEDAGISIVEDLIKKKQPDFLINNAGFGFGEGFPGSDVGSHIKMVRLHCETPVRLMHAAVPFMIDSGGGTIINVSSVAGFFSSPGSGNYCASKAYLTTMSKSLNLELESYGIKVQALCPGFTHTGFHDTEDMKGFDKSEIPSSMWMSAEDVVDTSLKGLEKNKMVVIPGFIYRFVVWVTRLRVFQPLLRAVGRKQTQKILKQQD